jgi:hypothetical protein
MVLVPVKLQVEHPRQATHCVAMPGAHRRLLAQPSLNERQLAFAIIEGEPAVGLLADHPGCWHGHESSWR